ncbi:ACP S-malonyltransferase [Rathayibacter tritici]|uniref:[acyl-carrier-protein] S-malonyltransferase n=1 Tax=Rathayibacter tritici TaxID=33888 RepID=A0A160KRK2_9MICO|nr:ACP S-malonyltransferase [Rathayibacter tritici]AND15934.1 polyketide synthase [Rathayibacter tritici]PPI41065.1 [acyl-carrier-protein] S-malonyltransferase [Rathayibacter tritici]
MTAVRLFPGQGSQHKGMGAELFGRFPSHVAEADHVLGWSLRDLCLDDPDGDLGRTQYTQPALYAVSALGHLARLEDAGVAPEVYAGHSLGEYVALFAAGAVDFATGLRLVARRGALMSEAPAGSMAAVLGCSVEQVEQILDNGGISGVEMANINSNSQIVLSGPRDEMASARLVDAVEGHGGALIPLAVSAAFHSSAMADVEATFAADLRRVEWGPLGATVVSNWTARPYPRDDFVRYLSRQISQPVRWHESISWLLHQGYEEFEEVGPGTVLTKLVTQIKRHPAPVPEDTASTDVTMDAESRRVVPAPPVPRPVSSPAAERLVFLYGGYGTQYRSMGVELYASDTAFRDSVDRVSELFVARGGPSVVAELYDPAVGAGELIDPSASHAALFTLGFALTEALAGRGVCPDAVMGHSLGEYVAAVVAGALNLDDAVGMLVRQADLIGSGPEGSMVSVLAAPSEWESRRHLFPSVELASVSFSGNFVLSGGVQALAEARRALDDDGLVTVELPARSPFHSSLLDRLRGPVSELGASVPWSMPRISLFSFARDGRVAPDQSSQSGSFFWDALRRPTYNEEALRRVASSSLGTRFVDLSATGSFANAMRHGMPDLSCSAAMNRFGKNSATMAGVVDLLRPWS